MTDGTRGDNAKAADFLVEAQRRAEAAEGEQARGLLREFVGRARERGLAPTPLEATPWSGGGSYRTDRRGWYLRKDRSIAVGEDGAYYLLTVPPVPFGRLRTIELQPSEPPLIVGKGGRDGETMPLADLLARRLEW